MSNSPSHMIKSVFPRHILFSTLLAIFSIIFFSNFATQSVSAQGTWTVQVEFDNSPPIYWSDWVDNASLGRITVSNVDPGSIPTEIQLFMTVTETSRGIIATAESEVLSIGANDTLTLSPGDDIDYSNIDYNSEYEIIFTSTSALPGGSYTICFEVRDAFGGAVLGQSCASFTIVLPESPTLGFPCEDDTIFSDNPIFDWTEGAPNAGIVYNLFIGVVDTENDGTPLEALQNSTLHYYSKEFLYANNFSYDFGLEPAFEPGVLYAWRVQALYEDGLIAGPNSGYSSNICTFTYQSDTLSGDDQEDTTLIVRGTVELLDRKVGDDGHYFTQYVVEFCEVFRKSYKWEDTGATRVVEVLPDWDPDQIGFEFPNVPKDAYFRLTLRSSDTADVRTYYSGDGSPVDTLGDTLDVGNIITPRRYQKAKFIFSDGFANDPFGNAWNNKKLHGDPLVKVIVNYNTEYNNNGVPIHAVPPDTLRGRGNVNSDTMDKKVFPSTSVNYIIEAPGYKTKNISGGIRRGSFNLITTDLEPKPMRLSGDVTYSDGVSVENFSGANVLVVLHHIGRQSFTQANYVKGNNASYLAHSEDTVLSIVIGDNGFFDTGLIEFPLDSQTLSTRDAYLKLSITDPSGEAKYSGSGGFYDSIPMIPDSQEVYDIPFTTKLVLVSGTVTGSHLLSVEKALVGVYRYGAGGVSSTTPDESMLVGRGEVDSLGAYSCSIPINSPANLNERYYAIATHPAYKPQINPLPYVVEGVDLVSNFNIKLNYAIIRGIITNPAGAGLATASVILKKLDISSGIDSTYLFSPREDLESNLDGGKYEFANLAPGTYKLFASAPGHKNYETSPTPIVYGNLDTMNIELDNSFGTVTVLVVDSTEGRTPVITVLNNVEVNSTSFDSSPRRTNNAGIITAQISPGEFVFTLVKRKYKDITITHTVIAGETDTLRIVLEPEIVDVIVKVVNSSGASLQKCVVVHGSKTDTTGSGGTVKFPKLSYGQTTFDVLQPKSEDMPNGEFFVPQTKTYTVGSGKFFVNIILEEGAKIGGVVTNDSDRVLDSVLVYVEGNTKLKDITDSNGVYAIAGIPAGNPVVLIAERLGYTTGKIANRNFALTAGTVVDDANFVLKQAPINKLFGFDIALDSVKQQPDGKKLIYGALKNIKPSAGVKFSKTDQKLYFKDVELDSDNNPTATQISLVDTVADIKLFDMEGVMSLKGGLSLELVQADDAATTDGTDPPDPPESANGDGSDTGGSTTTIAASGIGHIAGNLILADISKFIKNDSTIFIPFLIPKTDAPSVAADGVYRGAEEFGLTVTDSSVILQVRRVAISVDYQQTRIDSTGFHFYGEISFKDKEDPSKDKYALKFAPIHLAKDEDGDIVLKKITISTKPVIEINLGAFKVFDSTTTWSPDGFEMKGSLLLHKLKTPREFGFQDLKVSNSGEFLSMTLTAADSNGTVTVHGQKFTMETLKYDIDGYGDDAVEDVPFLEFSGKMEITKLDKPVEFKKMKYTWNDEFTGTIGFNQTFTVGGLIQLELEDIAFQKDVDTTKGQYVGVSGSIRFGAINGLKLEAGNFRFYHTGKFEFDEVGAELIAGPTEVYVRVGWTDSTMSGAGTLKIRNKFTVGAVFHYNGEEDWGVQITSGTRIPLGSIEIIDATGGVEYSEKTWKFLVGGTFAPKGSAEGVSLIAQVEFHKKPDGLVIIGSADVEVGGSLQIGTSTFILDLRTNKLDGSIFMVYDKTGVKAQAQIDIGIQFGSYWYIYGKPEVDFVGFFKTTGHVVLGENWTWVNEGKSLAINGIHVEIVTPFELSENWLGIIDFGVSLNQLAKADIDWAGTKLTGSIELDGKAWAGVGIEAGIFDVDLISAGADLNLKVKIKKTDYQFKAVGTGSFQLWGKIGTCDIPCPGGICWDTWGAVACIGMNAEVKYRSRRGLEFSASF